MLGLRGIAAKIFGTTNDRKVAKYRDRVGQINALEAELAALKRVVSAARVQPAAAHRQSRPCA